MDATICGDGEERGVVADAQSQSSLAISSTSQHQKCRKLSCPVLSCPKRPNACALDSSSCFLLLRCPALPCPALPAGWEVASAACIPSVRALDAPRPRPSPMPSHAIYPSTHSFRPVLCAGKGNQRAKGHEGFLLQPSTHVRMRAFDKTTNDLPLGVAQRLRLRRNTATRSQCLPRRRKCVAHRTGEGEGGSSTGVEWTAHPPPRASERAIPRQRTSPPVASHVAGVDRRRDRQAGRDNCLAMGA